MTRSWKDGSFSAQLLPCPWCAGTALLEKRYLDRDEETFYFFVVCAGCKANGPWIADQQTLGRAAWNLRTLRPRAWLNQERRGTEYFYHPRITGDSRTPPCPFCGQDLLSFDLRLVTCLTCEATGPHRVPDDRRTTIERVIKKWSERKGPLQNSPR